MTPRPPFRVLFLCTGNYYRSRFAELLFNHLAAARSLNIRAVSRGLKIDRTGMNQGDVSPHTLAAIRRIGIDPAAASRSPADLTYGDLSSANWIIAMKEAEHRPMLDASFPGWSERTIYWNVHDLDAATPEQTLGEIETKVRDLLAGVARLDQSATKN
jgi:protein-tyrosine phosphatase